MANTIQVYFPYFSVSVVKNCWKQTFVSLLGFLFNVLYRCFEQSTKYKI